MTLTDKNTQLPEIKLIPFSEEYYSEYEKIYNECFYDIRKALDIRPYNFYSNIEQLMDRIHDIYLLIKDNIIVGSVACIEHEIDDLIVNKKYQGQGIGTQLLLWAINNMKKDNDFKITLHVAKWNERALKLYKKNGFVITKTEKIS